MFLLCLGLVRLLCLMYVVSDFCRLALPQPRSKPPATRPPSAPPTTCSMGFQQAMPLGLEAKFVCAFS